MSKKFKQPKQYVQDRNVITENISDLCTDYMKIFGANNNLMRHLPSLSDGLKPGERRILYAMHELGHGKMFKVAKIAGDVIGKYHPHGDASVIETLVKMGQPWNNNQILVKGQGNFGSIHGDKHAAGRYIEATLSKYAIKCFFEEFDMKYIGSKPTFDGESLEPEYLPSRYPNVMINNTFGIGYGISTGIPSYNLREVLELTIKLLDDPDYEDIVLIPDCPTGADIVDEGNFKEISETGKGKFKMRGHIDIDFDKDRLTITSIPIQVSLNDIKMDIIKLQDDNKIQGIKAINDNSNEENGVEFHILLKKEIDPVTVRHAIYTKTNMEKTYSVNFKLVDDYQENDYDIRSILLEWIALRRETKRIIYNYKLISYMERQHTLEMLLNILSGRNGEKSIEVIRKSDSKNDIIVYLMDTFGMTSLQAKQVADMKLSAFSKEAIRRYKAEKEEVDKKVKKYDKLIRSNKKIDKIIHDELQEGIELFGAPRRSKVINIDGEEKIRNTDHIVVFTLNGMVKKLPEDVKNIGHINQGDYPIEICHVNNTTDLLIFDETGKISKLPVHSLNNSELSSAGELLNKYCSVQGKITSIIPKPTIESLAKIKSPVYFVMITKNGIIKKTLANTYVNIKNELLGLIVKDRDELKSVRILVGDKDLVVYTNKGFGLRFPSTDVRETNRMSIGVKALDLTDDEVVIGMDIVNDNDKYLFALTNKGNGKKSTMQKFETMERAGKPLRIISLDEGEEVMLIKTVRGDEKYKAFLKSSIESINIEDVVELPRLSKGRKLIPVRKGEVIIDIKEDK